MLLDPRTPFTSRRLPRHRHRAARRARVASAYPPDGPIFLYWESSLTAAQRDLPRARRAAGRARGRRRLRLAERSTTPTACSTTARRGSPSRSAAASTGRGARPRDGDADSYQVFYLANNLDPATEAIEADMPVVVLRKEYAPDTAGAGYNRGGAAVLKDTLFLRDAAALLDAAAHQAPSGIGRQRRRATGRPAATGCSSPRRSTSPSETTLPRTGDRLACADVTPVAGVLDPETQAARPGRRVLLLRPRADLGHQAAHDLPLPDQRRRRLGRPARRASPSA